MHEQQDEIELGDLENDAFLPGRNSKPVSKSGSVLTRWLPLKLRIFLANVSRIKLVIIFVIMFVLALTASAYINSDVAISPVKLSEETLALSKNLAQIMENTTIPAYVLEYAPYVFLHSSDVYYPSDMALHIANTHPTVNFTAIPNSLSPLTLDNLDELNKLGGENIFLSSTTDLTKLPEFLHGQAPDPVTLRTNDAISTVVIVVDKGNGTVDAFYMYFYTFNDGPKVLWRQVGNHLGDWEHNMIRFKDGSPQAVWYSQHEFGFAYTYNATLKIGKRPLSFSAMGSHANYAKPGAHDLHRLNGAIPAHLVFDHTNQGKLWDPTLSAYYYNYSVAENVFTPALERTPVNYLYFNGRWGDDKFPKDHAGQQEFHGYVKWIAGPQGPLLKDLDRADVCLPTRKCEIRISL